MTLEDAIQMVITVRNQYHLIQSHVHQLREAWATQHADLLQEHARSREAMHQAEAMLRALAIELYQSTGSKDLAPGVKVREMTRLIYDPQTALSWALTHQMALALDVKTFEQLARVTVLPFVRRWSEPQATLSSCLPGELPGPTAPEAPSHPDTSSSL
jgi:hypothetical protein